MAGAVGYHRPGQEVITLAVVQQLMPNQGDGWRHMLVVLRDYFGRPEASTGNPSEELPGPSLPLVALLGRRTAQMHLALASDTTDPAFVPEPLTEIDLLEATTEVQRQADAALAATDDDH